MTTKPLTFERGLAKILGEHRHGDADDARFAMIVIGYLHEYVQRLDVRGAACVAVVLADAIGAGADITPEQAFATLRDNDEIREATKRIVAAVVGSVMEVKL